MGVFRNGGYIGVSHRISEPIAFVGGKTFAGTSTVSIANLNINNLVGGLSSAPIKGDLVVVAFSAGSTADRAITVAGNNSGTYTQIAELYSVATTTYDTNLEVAYKVMGDTPDTSLSFTVTTAATSDAYAVAVHVWRFVDETTPLDVTSTTATASGSALANPPAITPVTPGSYVLPIAAAAHASGAQYFLSPEDAVVTFFSNGGNSTNDVTVGIGAYREWTTGAYDPAAWRFSTTNPTSGSWAAVTVALRPKYNVNGSTGIWSLQAKYNDSERFYE